MHNLWVRITFASVTLCDGTRRVVRKTSYRDPVEKLGPNSTQWDDGMEERELWKMPQGKKGRKTAVSSNLLRWQRALIARLGILLDVAGEHFLAVDDVAEALVADQYEVRRE